MRLFGVIEDDDLDASCFERPAQRLEFLHGIELLLFRRIRIASLETI